MDQNADSDEDELPVAAPISRKRYVDDWNFGFRPLFGSAKRQREKEPAAASNSSTNKSFEDILQVCFYIDFFSIPFGQIMLNIFKDELRIYKAMPSIDAEDDVFQWYQVNGKSFPNLAYIARRFLCVPPSSVDSERNFSVSKRLHW